MDYVKNSGNFKRRSKRSRGLRRRLVLLLVLGCAVLFAVWGWSQRRERAVAAPRTVPVIVRVPRSPQDSAWSRAQIARLHAGLRAAFAPALEGADRWSFAVLDGQGRTIFSDRADRAVTPASTAKLLVAATSLNLLGARFRYHTIFAAQQAVAPDGSLAGKLWLGGSGDPSLRSDDLHAGIVTLTRGGLRTIGGLAVDPTAMQGPQFNPHWDPNDQGQDYAAPTDALSIDGDTIESKQIVGGIEERFWTPVRDVPRYAASLVEGMLRVGGIASSSSPVVAPAPIDSIVLWDHPSAPLSVLETHMLVHSDNHYAEQLLRTLGRETAGVSDDSGGVMAERDFLSERGVPVPGLRLQDGSGLAPGDRISAITLARVLSDGEARGGDASLYRMLPLGGRQGTLADYPFTDALGRVRAKSGHITGVSSLAGYVNTRHHGRLVFAFLINGSPGDPDAAIVHAVDRLSDS